MLSFGKDHKSLWVISALNLKHRNEALTRVLIEEDGTMVCTDGYRLHVAEELCQGEEAGLYDVIKKTKTCVVINKSKDFGVDSFPDWRRVVPSTEGMREHDLSGNFHFDLADIIRKMSDNLTVNCDFVHDVLSNVCSYTLKNEAILFKGEKSLAVLMSIRITK